MGAKIYGAFWPLSAALLIVVAFLLPTRKAGLDAKAEEQVGSDRWLRLASTDHRQEAQRIYVSEGCAAPRSWAARLPFGLDLLIRVFLSTRRGRVCEFFRDISEQSGSTHEQRLRKCASQMMRSLHTPLVH